MNAGYWWFRTNKAGPWHVSIDQGEAICGEVVKSGHETTDEDVPERLMCRICTRSRRWKKEMGNRENNA